MPINLQFINSLNEFLISLIFLNIHFSKLRSIFSDIPSLKVSGGGGDTDTENRIDANRSRSMTSKQRFRFVKTPKDKATKCMLSNPTLLDNSGIVRQENYAKYNDVILETALDDHSYGVKGNNVFSVEKPAEHNTAQSKRISKFYAVICATNGVMNDAIKSAHDAKAPTLNQNDSVIAGDDALLRESIDTESDNNSDEITLKDVSRGNPSNHDNAIVCAKTGNFEKLSKSDISYAENDAAQEQDQNTLSVIFEHLLRTVACCPVLVFQSAAQKWRIFQHVWPALLLLHLIAFERKNGPPSIDAEELRLLGCALICRLPPFARPLAPVYLLLLRRHCQLFHPMQSNRADKFAELLEQLIRQGMGWTAPADSDLEPTP